MAVFITTLITTDIFTHIITTTIMDMLIIEEEEIQTYMPHEMGIEMTLEEDLISKQMQEETILEVKP